MKISNNRSFQPNQSFLPNQSQNMTNSGPERGKPEVSTSPLYPPTNKSREEDSICVLTMSHDFKKK